MVTVFCQGEVSNAAIAAAIARETRPAVKLMFYFILLQHLSYCWSGFMCNKIK